MTFLKRLRDASIAAGLVAGAAFGTMLITVPPASAESPQPAGISEETNAMLARMSKTLLSPQFSFRSQTMRAYVGPNGELLHVAFDSKIVVRRPDRLAVDVTGDSGSTKLFYDGKTLVAYNPDEKKYSSIPVPGKIDEMVDAAESRLGADFPLADLLTDNPEKSILSGVTSGGQIDVATIGGVKCRHFFFNESPDIDLELWVEDNDRALLRRVYVTYRSLPGHPTFSAELSDWDFSIHPADAEFVFTPPAGVTKVEPGTVSQTPLK